MARMDTRPLMNAVKTVLETIVAGTGTIAVGDATDPNHAPPYLILSEIASFDVEGSMAPDDLESDVVLRFQVTAVGSTAEQARGARDAARAVLTVDAVDDEISGRVTMYLLVDISFAPTDVLGLPEPRFSAADQYLWKTTPS